MRFPPETSELVYFLRLEIMVINDKIILHTGFHQILVHDLDFGFYFQYQYLFLKGIFVLFF